ncbi:Na+/H+ antiporter NhaC [Aureibacillus halotolerans]|uniref:Transporter (NhaC family) n=1 Tax=Aureibacillus halotolerans TaxID=1508390 RepID=A0A4R6U828_9BACI|nr:Na+/H+ antiporter NhaC [Aureibacillus halotolerans]TDQ42688.1 transporter (NhaC family) [Aureibacillus halotolerans]
MTDRTTKRPSVTLAAILLVLSMLILIIGIGVLKYPGQLMLIMAGALLTISAVFHGSTFDEVISTMSTKIKKALPAILILLSIGLLIGSWISAGTIPFLVYYGLTFIDPQFIFIMAFVITAIVSTCTGTSWGSAGTVGVALMSVAATLDVSLAITAGAVISGAYFGDKLSPLSDTTIMSALSVEVSVYDHIRHMLYTNIPSAVIAAIVFTTLGINSNNSNVSVEEVTSMLNTLSDLFHLNLVVLLPAIVVIVGSLMKKNPLLVIISSSFTAMLLAIFLQGAPLGIVFSTLADGFSVKSLESYIPGLDSSTLPESVVSLMERGGLASMYAPTFIVFCAFFFASALEQSQVLVVFLEKVTSYLKSTGSVIFTSLVTGFSIVVCTSNSYVTFFLMKDLFGELYKKQRLHRMNLSRSMEDSITVTEALMPWTVSGVFMATTLGVENFEFLPFAIFNLGGFVFSALYAFLSPVTKGFGIRKLSETDSEPTPTSQGTDVTPK